MDGQEAHASCATNPKEIKVMSITTKPSAENKAMRRSAKRLSTYLSDHLADETLSIELVERAIRENKGRPLWAFLVLLSWELEEDRGILIRLMGQLGVRRKGVRIILPWIAEKVGRMKLNGQFTGYSPLNPLVELEMLHRGINGKLDMWHALRHSVGNRVDGIDFDELIRRAERQAEELERSRLDVAANALSYGDASAAVTSGGTPLTVA
jgi:hypothetical protein